MKTPNHLAGQKSPYLVQHSLNPVDWYPWSEKAFSRARDENKPVFLSIGYSTCHWCHVMERESFEDEEIARLLNESFISIKVDREERPDIDRAYMAVCRLMTGSGGWPLTIMLTPEKKPFFAGTYIPKKSMHGRTGLAELLGRVKAIWKDRRCEIDQSAEKIIEVMRADLAAEPRHGAGRVIGADCSARAYQALASSYDQENGGFGSAPKFPSLHNIIFLLRYREDCGPEAAREMAMNTLKKIRLGGIYDQIGFGIHRYSTDEKWLLPHFEKMLYDQAMFALSLAEAYRTSGDAFYSRTAAEVCEYVLRDMSSPEGGFYSAEDADSEGEEGKYYLWTTDEISAALGATDADFAANTFNLAREGNFLEEATGQKTGKNILCLAGVPEDAEKLGSVRKRLLAAREKRRRPFKDDKILTDWNGLMIAALARCAALLDDQRYLVSAEKAADFISSALLREGDLLLHRYRDGESAINGNLDDYAFFAWGLIELYESGFKPEHLDLAVRIAGSMLRHFSGPGGALLFSPRDGEELVPGKPELYDGAYPSGNSIAFDALTRLGRLTGDPAWENAAGRILEAASPAIRLNPHAHTMFLSGIRLAPDRSFNVVLGGASTDPVLKNMLRELYRRMPRCAVLATFSDRPSPLLDRLAPFAKESVPPDGKTAAYVCSGSRCSSPVRSVSEMLGLLE